ncbi:hypothetical protein [Desulfatiglans anilini]|uniref:hypothetical protein n=1 Tax=Desulfatiglans anilini TaxID=90728 RepID=UPI00048259DC|nr:hypothetical protein [Desulfatiglans anilini]
MNKALGTIILLGLTVASLAGCANLQPTIKELKPVPDEAIFAPTIDGPRATLTMLRTNEFEGGAAAYHLFIDGEMAAEICVGEYLSVPVRPGERIIEVRHERSWGAPGDSETIMAAAGKQYCFWITSGSMSIRMIRTTPEAVEVATGF